MLSPGLLEKVNQEGKNIDGIIQSICSGKLG